MIDTTMKVREVALIPEATRVLEKLRIDYCCGGERPVGEACELAGIKLDMLQQKLDEAQSGRAECDVELDFQQMSLSKLIDHIVDKHHVFTTHEMERLEALTKKVLAAHGPKHPELIRVGQLLQALFSDLRPHMFKEEQVLFPFVVALENAVVRQAPRPFAPFGTVNNPVRVMMMEHDIAGDLLKELRQVTSDYTTPPDACMSYQTLYQALEAFEQDLHQHIHLENNILFPKAIDLEHDYRSR